MQRAMRLAAVITGVAIMLTLADPAALYAGKKKKTEAAPKQPNILDVLDYSKIVWPNPPAVTRIKYLNYFCCDKFTPTADKKKSSWMDRMAGGETQQQQMADKPLFALWTPYGLAVDSKGNLYVADGKVGAIFIFNTETKELQMIKHGLQARFGDIIGLAIDDSDRLFVSDTKMHRILVFDKNHKVEGTIAQGLVDPGGMAVDNENRFLYVADAALDLVLVYDADKLTLLRKIGTPGKNHTLVDPGQFAVPTNVAVDSDGNLYVTDTYNNRIEIFDADGNFIRQFGKAGDRPGTFIAAQGNRHRCGRACLGRRRGAGPGAVLYARRRSADLDGRTRHVAGAIPHPGRTLYRQEQPDLHVRAISRTGADVPLLHRRRSESGIGSAQASREGELRWGKADQ